MWEWVVIPPEIYEVELKLKSHQILLFFSCNGARSCGSKTAHHSADCAPLLSIHYSSESLIEKVPSSCPNLQLNFHFQSHPSFQFQINRQSEVQQPDSGIDASRTENGTDDDIDAALSELQITLEGPNAQNQAHDITKIPELTDYMYFLKYV